MKTCNNCGAVVENDNLNFCTKCGAALVAKPNSNGSKFCTKCGNARLGIEKFCTKCGNSFDDLPLVQQQPVSENTAKSEQQAKEELEKQAAEKYQLAKALFDEGKYVKSYQTIIVTLKLHETKEAIDLKDNIIAKIVEQNKVQIQLMLDSKSFDEALSLVTNMISIDPQNVEIQQLKSIAENAIYEEKRNKNLKIVTVAVIVIALLCGAVFYVYNLSKQEEKMWLEAQIANDIELYEAYIKKYPDGKNVKVAKEKVSQLTLEKKQWEIIANTENVNEIVSYIKKFPKSKYIEQAKLAYDELSWKEAQQANDQEAYQKYMNLFPTGKYYKNAQKMLEMQEKLTLNFDEENSATSTVKTFLNALANDNESELLSTLSPQMTYFLGKKGATKVDALAYMKRIHASDVFNVSITIGVTEVEKSINSNDDPFYTVKVQYDQQIKREDTSNETFASCTATARINNEYQIVSFKVVKNSHY